MSDEVERSGPPRKSHSKGVQKSEEVVQDLREWLKAIRDDGADIDEAIERLKPENTDTVSAGLEVGEAVEEGESDAE